MKLVSKGQLARLAFISALGPCLVVAANGLIACSAGATDGTDSAEQDVTTGAPTLQVTSDATNVTFTVSYSGTPTVIELFIDDDRNSSTGYPVKALGAGLMVENGGLYRYSGTGGSWTWTFLKKVSVVSGSGKAVIVVSRTDLGSPSALDVIAKTSSPGMFSSKVTATLSSSTSTSTTDAGTTTDSGGTTTTTPTAGGVAGPTITSFKTSGPITVVSGQTVTGLAISNPNGPCIYGNGASNVHIYNNKIGPCGPLADGTGVYLVNTHDVLVEHNSFDDVAGGMLVNTGTNNVVFDHNYATRIRGPFPRGQMVQFAAVNGSGHRITCNVSDQTTPGYGNGTEDHVNMYRSNGTAASPILVKNNKIRGGGPSQSGGGILAGDEASSYMTIDSNILVNPGQYGVGIAGGNNNKILNNKVYSSSFPWTNVGVYVWSQYTPACYGHEVSGNHVNWTNRDGVKNNWENGGNCGAITMVNNVFGDSTIGPSIWDETFPDCN